jgi:hypothetical protein
MSSTISTSTGEESEKAAGRYEFKGGDAMKCGHGYNVRAQHLVTALED